MPAAAKKAAISFGMVHIPISLYTAVQEKGIGFNQLTANGIRIRQKKVREDNGEEVLPADIVKGYEYSKGQYVIITDEEIERIKSERDKAIRILQFAPPKTIPSVYYDKSYLAVPDGSDKAYELLRRAMQEEGVVGIGQSVLWSKQTMMALIPEEGGIRIQTLFFHNQIKAVPVQPRQTEVTEAEMNMGRMLVQAMVAPYQPEKYRDEYQEKLIQAIQQKINGQEIVAATEPQGNVVDLMAALEKSIAMQQPTPQPQYSGVQ